MKKKNITRLVVLACVSITPMTLVHAQVSDTLEGQYSPEQVATWNAETPKPIEGDWKVGTVPNGS